MTRKVSLSVGRFIGIVFAIAAASFVGVGVLAVREAREDEARGVARMDAERQEQARAAAVMDAYWDKPASAPAAKTP